MSLCEAYGWTYDEAMSKTVPQLFMISHACWVSSERTKVRYGRKDTESAPAQEIEIVEEEPSYNGKPLSQCNSKEMALYYGSFFQDGGRM